MFYPYLGFKQDFKFKVMIFVLHVLQICLGPGFLPQPFLNLGRKS